MGYDNKGDSVALSWPARIMMGLLSISCLGLIGAWIWLRLS